MRRKHIKYLLICSSLIPFNLINSSALLSLPKDLKIDACSQMFPGALWGFNQCMRNIEYWLKPVKKTKKQIEAEKKESLRKAKIEEKIERERQARLKDLEENIEDYFR